jgi:hypothetical protein
MAKHAYAKTSESKTKYTVEIDRAEEKGGIKTIKFRDREAALNFAELLRKRQSKVRVLNPKGQEIYPCG